METQKVDSRKNLRPFLIEEISTYQCIPANYKAGRSDLEIFPILTTNFGLLDFELIKVEGRKPGVWPILSVIRKLWGS
jgi:hypothetical protein